MKHQQNGIRLRTAAILSLPALLLTLSGCGTTKQAQLEAVARDWCNTIRASQIIPVYPLTEDLQPGDLFLVQASIDKQQKLYQVKGFLPLDNHIGRLNPSGYTNFYDHSFLARISDPLLPSDWAHPTNSNSTSWESAPHAAFPTYSFSVKHGAGLNLAVPVQGVPVGLSLLGSDAADATVAIRKARTLGVDILSMYRQIQPWAFANQDFLRFFGASAIDKRTNYLRVITRIYATGEMDVSLNNANSLSGGTDVGVPKPVNLLFPTAPTDPSNTVASTMQNYTNSVGVLNDMLKEENRTALVNGVKQLLPGGSLRVTAASSRSISMKETFDPPLVVGYLGFDCAILKGGVLGAPIPTHAIINPNSSLGDLSQGGAVGAIYSGALGLSAFKALNAEKDKTSQAVVLKLNQLAKFIPDEFTQYSQVDGEGFVLQAKAIPVTQLQNKEWSGYENYHAYRGKLLVSIRSIEAALKTPTPFKLAKEQGDAVEVKPNSDLARELEAVHANMLQARDNALENNDCRTSETEALARLLELRAE